MELHSVAVGFAPGELLPFLGLAVWIGAFGAACKYLAMQKGYSPKAWFWLGAVGGIISLLVIGFAKDRTAR